ncbi:hypothetical protein ACFQH3_18500 [Haladaptatus sp. GCM10025707]
MVSGSLVAQQVVNGLLFGGQLALIAVGLTLIWGSPAFSTSHTARCS